MILNVATLSQRDNRWKDQRLGIVDETNIGGYGCIITCMSMLATYYGHPIFPDAMDNWLTDNQGYIQGNLYRNDAFPREFTDCQFNSVVSCTNTPAPLGSIDDVLKSGRPVVVMVDFDHNYLDGIQTHFVLLVGKLDNGHYLCNDPWFGDQTDFDNRYGEASKSINQINFFSGPIPHEPTPPPATQSDDEKRALQVLKDNIISGSNLEGTIRAWSGAFGDLTKVQALNSDLKIANSTQAQLLKEANQNLDQYLTKVNDLSKQLSDCQKTTASTTATVDVSKPSNSSSIPTSDNWLSKLLKSIFG